MFKKIWNWLLELFFPSNLKCIFCGRDIPDPKVCYCEDCAETLKFNVGQRCKVCDDLVSADSEVCENCKSHHKSFEKAVAPLVYQDAVRGVVLKLKNSNARYLAEPMARMMFERLQKENFDFDLLVPIPLSPKSLSKRKFNQAKLLADELGKLCNKPVDSTSLVKRKQTRHQKELGFLDRQKNLEGAFKIEDRAKILNKNILLVDDVMTTGATANECAKVLKKYANHVFVVTFARNRLTKPANDDFFRKNT